jgi:integrase
VSARAAQAARRFPPRLPGGLRDALDIALLAGAGWDPRSATFAPDRHHRLLGYRLCRVAGCGLEAWSPSGLCGGCLARFGKEGEGAGLDAFCRKGPGRKNRSRDRLCLVCRLPGFERPVTTNDLCASCDGLRRRRRQSVPAFVDGDGHYPPASPRTSIGRCGVLSCDRLAGHARSGLCPAHQTAWRTAGCPQLPGFRQSAPPCLPDQSGRVILAGLDAELITEILYGIQAALAEGRQVMLPTLRCVVAHLRRSGAASLAQAASSAPRRTPVRWFCCFAADRAALALGDVSSEYEKDCWDLRLFGAAGRLSFAGGGTSPRYPGQPATRPIAQAWLRLAAKAWAAEALCSMKPGPVRAMIGAVGLFSSQLSRRADQGTDPAVLSHLDVEAFLARLGHLERSGQLSKPRREMTVHLVARFLRDCREMGLAEPGGVLAGLPGDVAIRAGERPRRPRRDDAVGHALPEVVMAQLLSPDSLALLESRAGQTIRAAVELGAGTGRRTAELCSLRFTCLDYDIHVGEGGDRRASPVLVHDMPKVGKTGCRLPVHQREADIISAQQERVRAAYPDTPAERLALFPRPLKNPDGTKAIGTSHLQHEMRAWVQALERLDGPARDRAGQPVPFPRERVIPYAFRHSFAQRHADAGTPVDTLKELLGHDTVRTTLGYYRVTARRKRAAQDALGPLQISTDARRIRPDGRALLPAEALREQVGQVAVPFGICTEPANVAANGQSCPFRHRCLGCEYFRTDPSYQPELRAYLTQLLADAERFAAAAPQLADWARPGAAPAPEEIQALRRLIPANDQVLGGLGDQDRRRVEDAITTARRSRAALDATFPAQFRGLARQASPSLFPAIERAAGIEPRHG